VKCTTSQSFDFLPQALPACCGSAPGDGKLPERRMSCTCDSMSVLVAVCAFAH